MTIISDLPCDLVEEILSRVLITSLKAMRSTCKQWNVLCKDQSFTKKHCGKASKELMLNKRCDWDTSTGKSQTRFNLHNIKDLPFIKEIGTMLISPVKIYEVISQCDGLLLLVTNNNSGLVLWNPYLAQTRWITPKNSYGTSDYYIGYDNKNHHKVLRLFYKFDFNVEHEIYDVLSNTWRVLDDIDITSDIDIPFKRGVSLNEHTYYVAYSWGASVICFDFTTEIFGPCLPLPFDYDYFTKDDVTLSCVREDQLAVFIRSFSTATFEMEIWITTKIEPNAMSWSKFFKVNIQLVCGFYFLSKFKVRRFFIDKEKKVDVVNGRYCSDEYWYDTSFVAGEDGYFEGTGLEDVFSYVPSSVQLQ